MLTLRNSHSNADKQWSAFEFAIAKKIEKSFHALYGQNLINMKAEDVNRR